MLSDVSWLDGNAVDDVNKMAGKVKEQTAAGQFATSLQTFTDLLYLIDSKSDSVNMFNYMTGTGMGMMLITGDNTPEARSSPLTRYLGRDISTIMNGVIKRKLKIIPKDLVWQQWSLDVYEAMKNDFMRPAINVVREQISLMKWRGSGSEAQPRIGGAGPIPERCRTLEKRYRDGTAHWACGTEAHARNCRAAPGWIAGPGVRHRRIAGPTRSRTLAVRYRCSPRTIKFSAQNCKNWKVADADIPEMADVHTLYPMQSAPVTHLTGDIAEELYAETTSLWEKLRDNIAGSHEDMMSALDRMRQKCKRIMRAASCRHASDVHRPTAHRFADPLPERPSTSSRPSTSRPSTSARPSTSTRPRPAVRPVQPSTIIGPHNEGIPQVNMPMFSTGTNDLWQGAQTYNTGGIYQMSINEDTQPQGASFLDMLGHGDWLFSQPPIMQPQTTGMYNPEQRMEYAGSTQSYGEPCSYGGGSSTAHHEIGPSQLDEPPPITQPTQDYSHLDFSRVDEVRRSVRERHSPERLSLSGRRPPTGARRKGKKQVTSTSRNFDDEPNE
ncbi:hypothetical protein OsI_11892 [Oryza sativa Indica Group]|uniref:Uncharacterized protein n=1 Tax=Oryza sativa subsp. indica TaxID=39946 RepID=B8AQZ6_ORYSI|nr:hypothetical protein OsI_11892 [Oryza sativa Indica Group]